MSIYLDYASTTPLNNEALNEMMPYLNEQFENPSSLYRTATKNKKAINQSRRKIANLINAKQKEIHFTSGGSEANNWALKGAAYASNTSRKEIITTKIEHHSISHTVEFMQKLGYTIHYLDVDQEGFINLQQLDNYLNENTLMVSIIMANNEIGTIQDIMSIRTICNKYDALLHVDAVQAICHVPVDVDKLGVDLLSMSAHKFYGPKGVGCLYIREGVFVENLIHGGKQEQGRRSGTENVPNIVGMAKALEIGIFNLEKQIKRQKALAQYLYQRLEQSIENIRLNGPKLGSSERLPGNINVSFKDIDGSILCFLLNDQNVYISTGSACNSGSIEPSHVLQAIQVPEDYIEGSVRISLGEQTTREEIDIFCNKVITIVNNDLA